MGGRIDRTEVPEIQSGGGETYAHIHIEDQKYNVEISEKSRNSVERTCKIANTGSFCIMKVSLSLWDMLLSYHQRGGKDMFMRKTTEIPIDMIKANDQQPGKISEKNS